MRRCVNGGSGRQGSCRFDGSFCSPGAKPNAGSCLGSRFPPLTKAPSMDQPYPPPAWRCLREIVCGGQFQKEGLTVSPAQWARQGRAQPPLCCPIADTQLRAWSTQSRLRALKAGPGGGSPSYPLPCGVSTSRGSVCHPGHVSPHPLYPSHAPPHLACPLHGSGSPLCPCFMGPGKVIYPWPGGSSVQWGDPL